MSLLRSPYLQAVGTAYYTERKLTQNESSSMSTMLQGQGSALVLGINSLEPYIYRLHKEFKSGAYDDWPIVVLITTLQTTTCSLFKLLPNKEKPNDALDMRSIATLTRNIVDTHDVLSMMTTAESQDEFFFNRDLLSHYIASRRYSIQNQLQPGKGEQHLKNVKLEKWKKITKSKLFDESMKRLKRGEQLFHESRKDRVKKVCGEHSDFVLAILSDISTHVHSVSPDIWFHSVDEIYANSKENRDKCAIWIRLSCFYLARCFEYFFSSTGYEKSAEINKFINHHREVFN